MGKGRGESVKSRLHEYCLGFECNADVVFSVGAWIHHINREA